MKLRDYQQQAVDCAIRDLRSHRSVIIVAATGTGKTPTLAAVAAKARKRVLVLCDRDILISQAIGTLHRMVGGVIDVEQGPKLAERHGSRHVAASIQTLSRDDRLYSFPGDAFGLIIVDEAHKARAGTYSKVFSYFADAKILGVTATPFRLDKKSVIGPGAPFEKLSYEMTARDAIDGGWLVPVRQAFVEVSDLKLSEVSLTKAGDYDREELGKILESERSAHQLLVGVKPLIGDGKTIVFAPTVNAAASIAKIARERYGIEAEALSGRDRPRYRRKILNAYMNGEFQMLVNRDLFVAGFDCWDIRSVVMGRNTKSLTVYSQALGRGTRVDPQVPLADIALADDRIFEIAMSRKQSVLMIDCVGAGREVDLSVSALDALMPSLPQRLREIAKRRIADGHTDSLEEAVEQSQVQWTEEQRSLVSASGKIGVEERDPFRKSIVHTQMSPAQERLLRHLCDRTKTAFCASWSKQQAHAIISRLEHEPGTAAGWQLAKIPVSPEFRDRMSYYMASKMIANREKAGV
jgi:superfamily II DNA or RNA helicase